MNKDDRVLMDSNAIIEAHRTRCWTNLLAFYSIETVDMCARECASGTQQLHRNYVPVDTNALRENIATHKVTDAMRLQLVCREPTAADIDDGEKDLLAFAMTLPSDVFLICSPDKACMKVAAKMGLLERLVSLQELANRVGRGKLNFKRNYTEKWHQQQCSAIRLEIM
jgi:hypothetical protein